MTNEIRHLRVVRNEVILLAFKHKVKPFLFHFFNTTSRHSIIAQINNIIWYIFDGFSFVVLSTNTFHAHETFDFVTFATLTKRCLMN